MPKAHTTYGQQFQIQNLMDLKALYQENFIILDNLGDRCNGKNPSEFGIADWECQELILTIVYDKENDDASVPHPNQPKAQETLVIAANP